MFHYLVLLQKTPIYPGSSLTFLGQSPSELSERLPPRLEVLSFVCQINIILNFYVGHFFQLTTHL